MGVLALVPAVLGALGVLALIPAGLGAAGAFGGFPVAWGAWGLDAFGRRKGGWQGHPHPGQRM